MVSKEAHLDNLDSSAKPTVQTASLVPACKVTLVFPRKGNEELRRRIAGMLLEASQDKKRREEHGYE